MITILGTGQIGQLLLEQLLRQYPDQPIQLVNRSGKINKPLPANVSLLAADVTNNLEMEEIAQRSGLIFSCTDVPYQQWSSFYPATAAALAFALRNTNARLVYADNLYSYGNVKGAIMDETMPHKATTKKGRIRAAVLNTLLYSGEDFSKRVAVVKASDFIGPDLQKAIFSTHFFNRLQQNKPIFLSGNLYLAHTFTYTRDFVVALINIGLAPDAFGQLWHAPNAPAISIKEWISHFEKSTGKKARIINLPKPILWLAGRFSKLIHELYELAYQYDYPYLVSHEKYAQRFGKAYTKYEL